MTRTRLRGDGGSAVVEFCLLSVLMLVPLVYLVAVLGRVQAASFAAQTAAREAGRAFVTAPDDESAEQLAQSAAAIAFDDQGFGQQGIGTLDVACTGHPCLAPDARIESRTRVLVLLPGVPRVLDRVVPTRIEITARQVVTVDRFRPTTRLVASVPGAP